MASPMFGGVSSSYGTSATTYGQNPTDSYYITSTGQGTQVIKGNLRVQGNLIVDYSTTGGTGFFTGATTESWLGDVSAADIIASSLTAPVIDASTGVEGNGTVTTDILVTTAGAQSNSIQITEGNIQFYENDYVYFTIDNDIAGGDVLHVTSYGEGGPIDALRVDVSGDVTFGANVSVTGNLTAPNVVNSVTAGTNITVTGTATNPVINAVTNLNPNVILDLYNSTPIAINTPAGGAMTTLTTYGSMTVGKTYLVSLTGSLVSSINSTAQMIVALKPTGLGEFTPVFGMQCSDVPFQFSTTVAITMPATSFSVVVLGGGSLTVEVITLTLSNSMITQIN